MRIGQAAWWTTAAFTILAVVACPNPEPDGEKAGSSSSTSSSTSGGASSGGTSSSAGAASNGSGSGTSSGGASTGSTSSSGGTTGTGRVGDPCSTAADCTELTDMECYTTVTNPFSGEVVANFPGGFCSKGCPNGDECGDEYACATMSQSGGNSSAQLQICVPTCSTSDECRAAEGYTCKTFFGLGGYCSPP
ncbi:MAG: hypothetical protein AB2A00_19340 [Myxococcota bacterium]